MRWRGKLIMLTAVAAVWTLTLLEARCQPADDLRVGAAAVPLEADDSMVIGGSILAHYAKGQEGELRAVAVVLEKPGQAKVAIVACDVLFVTRDFVDAALAEIEAATGIPPSHVLVNATHTHHAPSTTRVHGYAREEVFCQRIKEGIVRAVRQADENLAGNAQFWFHLGQEATVGANSRLKLADGMIYWIGSRDDAVGPTGPFDPQLPVLAFKDAAGGLRALLFNHSTHTIGTRRGAVRSPSFYGLAAQELERELGGTVCFLEGASGSTHNITGVATAEAVERMKHAVTDALAQASERPVPRLASLKRRFTFPVRKFDDAVEDEKVMSYCRTRTNDQVAETYGGVFREMRRQLAPQQGQPRETWLQAMLIGDVAIVGVPAEYFTALGVEIKRRSPLPNTYVAELANDWIGYLPDREGHGLGGYQTWMGLHSYAEIGTGERIVLEVTDMLKELVAGG